MHSLCVCTYFSIQVEYIVLNVPNTRSTREFLVNKHRMSCRFVNVSMPHPNFLSLLSVRQTAPFMFHLISDDQPVTTLFRITAL